jgi:hypothetical protein
MGGKWQRGKAERREKKGRQRVVRVHWEFLGFASCACANAREFRRFPVRGKR